MITVLVTFATLLLPLLIGAVPTIEGIDSAQADLCCVIAIDALYIDDVCAYTVTNCGGYDKCFQSGTSYNRWCLYCLVHDPSYPICLTGTWPPVGEPPALYHGTLDIDLDSIKEPESFSTGIPLV
jgi:hypothetical protein